MPSILQKPTLPLTTLLAGLSLALALLPDPAAAGCICGCSGGQAISACTGPLDIAPPCQRICPLPLSTTVSTAPIVLPGTVVSGGGAVPTTDAFGNPLSPDDQAAAAAAAAAAQGGLNVPDMNVGVSGALPLR